MKSFNQPTKMRGCRRGITTAAILTLLGLFPASPARALTINFVYDTDANLQAAGLSASDITAMKAANTYAAKLLTDKYKDNITVNIMVKASPGTNDFGSSSTTFDSVDTYDALAQH